MYAAKIKHIVREYHKQLMPINLKMQKNKFLEKDSDFLKTENMNCPTNMLNQ